MHIKLIEIAHARSGDKGDTANIGVIARKPSFYAILVQHLTCDRVRNHFEGICLGEGGATSLKNEAQGKSLASFMLSMELDIETEDPG
jgi:hypothetical protein